jgi:hypothetical protein
LHPRAGKVEAQALAVMEGQLTWLMHLVGAIIRGRLSSSSAESQVRLQSHVTLLRPMCRTPGPAATDRRRLISKVRCRADCVHQVWPLASALSLPSLCPQEPIDGDLAARVFGLLQVVDTGTHAARVEEHTRQRLDIALLGFFQNFRKVYIGEQVMHCSKVRAGAAS